MREPVGDARAQIALMSMAQCARASEMEEVWECQCVLMLCRRGTRGLPESRTSTVQNRVKSVIVRDCYSLSCSCSCYRTEAQSSTTLNPDRYSCWVMNEDYWITSSRRGLCQPDELQHLCRNGTPAWLLLPCASSTLFHDISVVFAIHLRVNIKLLNTRF